VLSTLHTNDAPSAITRLLDLGAPAYLLNATLLGIMAQRLVRNMVELGFSEQDEARWKSISAQPHGIILVTGPTGSGKTTTLYSTLKQLATPEVNVCTIEDPIEMVEPAFNQMQVHQAIDLGFAEGVRALMRQDPDIIMVGEIRDLETTEMAIQGCSRRCTPTMRRRPSPACSTWARRPTCSMPPCWASWPSAWCASCAPTARRPTR